MGDIALLSFTCLLRRAAARGSVCFVALIALLWTDAAAQVAGARISSAPTGTLEAGLPSFVVLGPEALGLGAAPTDLHVLPDGRLLVISRREIAFGDGVRWESFAPAEGQSPMTTQVTVDPEATIYCGVENGIGRVSLGEDGRWRVIPVSELPDDSSLRGKTMFGVSEVGEHWLWHGGSGVIVAWKPGRRARPAGSVSSIERIFGIDRRVFVSEQSSGGLFELAVAAATAARVPAADRLASETVTSSAPFAPGVLLVGTSWSGLKLFDGTAFQPFASVPLLQGGHRVTDVCAIGSDGFAAAIDTVGVVFFNRRGELQQVLDRSLDHRLARPRRLRYADNGVLWVLLNDGLARIEYPSPISHFEPLLASGLTYAKALRHQGELWLLADGRAMHAVYDASRRLERFEDRSPAGRYLFALAEVDGQLFASNEAGVYVREGDDWKLVMAGVVNARVGIGRTRPAGIPYTARGEVGFLQRTAEGYAATRIPVPQLGDAFNAGEDAEGIIWLELGTSLVGRLDVSTSNPTLQVLGTAHGLSDGWVELSILHGVARFHIALSPRSFRFDEARQRFVIDEELLRLCGPMNGAGGRPTPDALGRLWFSADGTPQVLDLREKLPRPHPFPIGFAATEYVAEDNGVMWAQAGGQFARIDPRIPRLAPRPVRAVITSLQFSASNRKVFDLSRTLAPIPYADNSLVIRFAAPANPFASPVSFEFMLEGAGTDWVPSGTVGSAVFNRLEEGEYVFRVRPVTAQGPGAEARLSFLIRPPWYRSPLARVIYVLIAVGLIAFAAWLPAYLHRRETEQLERLVAKRTEELGRQVTETTRKSKALVVSEERYRTLNTELERRVQDRTAQLTRSHDELQQRESLFRLIFEHAPLGISWRRTDLGNVYHVNPTYQRILGLPSHSATDHAELLGSVHPEDAAAQEELNRCVASGRMDSYSVEERFVLADGRVIWGSLSVAVVRDATGRIVQDIGILEDITPRKDAESQLATTYKNLVDASRVAGMAEVATGVLHNVGNVLNSLNVSSNLLLARMRQSKAESLVRLSALLNERSGDLAAFLQQDPKGRLVPELLTKLAQSSVAERDWLQQEIGSMQKNIDHIKEIVAMQQSYATVIGVVETLEPEALFEDALRMNAAALARHDVRLIREFQPAPSVRVEKGKVLQILVNVIRNAKYACDDGQQYGVKEKLVTVRVEAAGVDRVRLMVRDNGIGIPQENLTRIFAHGFTTRTYGHGFGLHSSALAAQEMGGSLTAASDGLGRGATFTLELPAQPPAKSAGTAAFGASGGADGI